jgi:hypothetical protein
MINPSGGSALLAEHHDQPLCTAAAEFTVPLTHTHVIELSALNNRFWPHEASVTQIACSVSWPPVIAVAGTECHTSFLCHGHVFASLREGGRVNHAHVHCCIHAGYAPCIRAWSPTSKVNGRSRHACWPRSGSLAACHEFESIDAVPTVPHPQRLLLYTPTGGARISDGAAASGDGRRAVRSRGDQGTCTGCLGGTPTVIGGVCVCVCVCACACACMCACTPAFATLGSCTTHACACVHTHFQLRVSMHE